MLRAIENEQLQERFVLDVEEVVRKVLMITDPVQKETRIYTVEPYPDFIRAIIHYALRSECEGDWLDKWDNYFRRHCIDTDIRYEDSVKQVDSEWYRRLIDPVSKSMDHYIKMSVTRSFITVRCSTRTILKGKTMKRTIGRWIKSARVENMIPTLKDMIFKHDENLGHYLYDPLEQFPNRLHPFIQSAIDLLLAYDDPNDIATLIAHLRDGIDVVPGDLVMKTKLYVSRADIRAYYVDRDPVRHLCGSIIQQYFQGLTSATRSNFLTEDWLPSKDKNIVNMTIRCKDNLVVLITGGDISSFTNSDINSWVYGIAVYTIMRAVWDETVLPTTYCVDGELFTATLSVVLLTYLVLLIGAPSTLPNKENYVAPGGYLGVKGNMTLTTTAFALRLVAIQKKLMAEHRKVQFSGQIGGDDFFYIIIAESVEEAVFINDLVKADIEKYVGRLKDPTTEIVRAGYNKEYTLRLMFCKKSVYCSTYSDDNANNVRCVYLQSVQKLPFMGQLLNVEPELTIRKRLDELRKFELQMVHFFSDFLDPETWVNAYTNVYCLLYDLPGLCKLYYSTKVLCKPNVYRNGNREMTMSVCKILSMFSEQYSQESVHVTPYLEDKLGILMSCEAVQMTQCLDKRGVQHTVYHRERDREWFSSRTQWKLFQLRDDEFACALHRLFKDVRMKLRVLLEIDPEIEEEVVEDDVSVNN